MRDYPENYLDISFDHDYSMKVITHFEGMEDSEYELKIYEDMTGTGFFGDPFEGLTGSLWVNDPLEGCLTAEFGYIGEIDRSNPLFPYIIYYENGSRYGSEQYYVIDDNAENSDYYWDGNGGYEDAYFSPVYMTVIDREAGIRYEDIPLGSTPMSSGNRQIGKHSMKLYEEGKEWSTFDFDRWLPAHME